MHLLVSSLKTNTSIYKYFSYFVTVVFLITVKKNMNKRKVERDSKRQFNALRKNEFLFIAIPSGNPVCIIFESTLSDNTRHDLSGHYKKHQVEIEEKQKLVHGSELRKTYVVKKKEAKCLC